MSRNTRLATGSVSLIAAAAAKCGLLVLIGLLLFRNTAAVEDWFLHITKIEVAGFSISREATARDVEQLFNGRPDALPVAQGAIVRAIRSAPAISGSHILWVDSSPTSRQSEIDILENLGIRVQVATSVADVLRQQRLDRYDMIVSRLNPEEGDLPPAARAVTLDRCGGTLFEPVGDVEPSERIAELQRQNSVLSAHPPAGFALAERLAASHPRLVNRHRSFLIIYSGLVGEGSHANQCARLITNRAETMLHGVVSLLEEARWQKLEPGRRPAP